MKTFKHISPQLIEKLAFSIEQEVINEIYQSTRKNKTEGWKKAVHELKESLDYELSDSDSMQKFLQAEALPLNKLEEEGYRRGILAAIHFLKAKVDYYVGEDATKELFNNPTTALQATNTGADIEDEDEDED